MRALSLVIAFGAIAAGLGPQLADAQSKSPVRTFYGVLDLKQDGTGGVLIGGRPASSKDFPASFYSRSSGGNCTSTLVASRALLTAAHCVDDGARIALTLGKQTYEGDCTHSPHYAANKTADWALCLMSKDVVGIEYEKINPDAARVKLGTELLLTGFGCTQPGGTGGNDGIYRIGEAKASVLPKPPSNDIITKASSALCFGDSGGPAFLFLDNNKRDRVVVSVNSRGNISDTSYLSSTSTDDARKFFASWSASKAQKLCGLAADAVNCRK